MTESELAKRFTAHRVDAEQKMLLEAVRPVRIRDHRAVDKEDDRRKRGPRRIGHGRGGHEAHTRGGGKVTERTAESLVDAYGLAVELAHEIKENPAKRSAECVRDALRDFLVLWMSEKDEGI